MRRIVFTLFALLCNCIFAQIESDSILIKNESVYISMVHTPNGHVLQKAPYSIPFYSHLVIGSGPETIYYAFVNDIKDFYSNEYSEIRTNTEHEGTVFDNAKISIEINKPSGKQLFNLPNDLTCSIGDVKYSTLLLFGTLNKPCFDNSNDTFYVLRPILNTPIETTEKKLLLGFGKIELGHYVYFSESCVINGEHKVDNYIYKYSNVSFKKGWNLVGTIWGDGSDIFKGYRYITNLSKETKTFQVFIPYW